MNDQLKGWYKSGRLPHFDGGEVAQFLTFRLEDSLPAEVLDNLRSHLDFLPEDKRAACLRRNCERVLDKGLGACWLNRRDIAKVVQDCITFGHRKSYVLHSWAIMPNHVHLIVRPAPGHALGAILHSWKSFTAKRIHALVGGSGSIWQREYFDRVVRNERHLAEATRYIHQNPVQAGLIDRAERWAFSSAFTAP